MVIAPKTRRPIEPGQFYRVPTVHGLFYGFERNWPVLGPRHEDAEYINYPTLHYHIDWRFADQVVFDEVTLGQLSDSAVFAWVLHDHPGIPPHQPAVKTGPIIYRRRKCYRDFPRYPREAAVWMEELTEAYSDHVLDDSLICPHRGASLATVPADKDGCVVCPLHGLKWNLSTRRLVR